MSRESRLTVHIWLSVHGSECRARPMQGLATVMTQISADALRGAERSAVFGNVIETVTSRRQMAWCGIVNPTRLKSMVMAT